VTVRDERAAALKRWHRDMGDNFAGALPKVLDALDAIDRQRVADVELDIEIDTAREAMTKPTDEQIAAWIERNPKAFADAAARQAQASVQRAAPGRVPPVPASDKPPKAPPATRRRTRT
jgi:hypothetical protein